MPVLSEATKAAVEAYWRSHLGISDGALWENPPRIVAHAGELEGYEGVFALLREGAAIVSLPPDRTSQLRPLIENLGRDFSPQRLVTALQPFASKVIGPAFIGHADHIRPVSRPARTLTPEDQDAVNALKGACSELEWEHGGSNFLNQPMSAVFCGYVLAALAGYEVWGSSIAHISIVTHPSFRGRGFGRAAVGHLAARAISAGLLPQYRTLDSNAPSMRIAESLGFTRYATSIAVRVRAA